MKRASRLVGVVALLVACLVFGCVRSPSGSAATEIVLLAQWTLVPHGATASPAPTPITVPAHFDGSLPNGPSSYTLKTTVELPPTLRGRDLVLAFPYFVGHASVRAEGRPTTPLERDLFVGYRARGPQAFFIDAERTNGASLRLDVDVEHTWTQSAWLDVVPRLHRAGERDGQTQLVRAVNDFAACLALAALAQLGVTYLAVFLVGRRRRAYVWFALQVFSAAFLHLHYLGATQLLLGNRDVALLGIMVSSASLVSIWFTHEQFKLGPPPRFFLALLAVDVLVPLAFSGPFLATKLAGKTTVLTVGIVVVYQLVTLGRLTLQKPRPLGAETVLMSWVVLGTLSVVDGASWVGLGELLGGVKGDCVGLALFAFMQSTLLGREHIGSLERSDQLNVALAERVEQLEVRQREVQVLNEELRRQITDRSRQLFAALALIGAPRRDPPSLTPGSVVQDRYRIARPIGQGGMGTVYEVVRVADGRKLALKVTRELEGVALARLAREAQIASAVAHRNVVGILDVDVDPSGFLYLVLEYVDGPNLRRLKPRFGETAWAVEILRQMAEGIAALHASGIVHRDLKPSNVLVSDPESDVPLVKITDFGISRIVVEPERTGEDIVTLPPPPPDRPVPNPDAETRELQMMGSTPPATLDPDAETLAQRPMTPPPSSSTGSAGLGGHSPLTEAGVLVGTPVYMAPELAFDPRLLSPAADVWSLGVMAYELLTGVAPFDAPPALERLEGRDISPPPSIAVHRPELDPEIIAMVDRCLSFDAKTRPSARELAQSLEVSVERVARAKRPA